MIRSKKTNKGQMEVLINFLEANRILVTGKSHPLHTDEISSKWVELTNLLNGVENGARKDQKQWKTFLYEWKSKTKKKARMYRTSISKTGGGGYKCIDLSEFENRLMSIYGWVHVVGCPGAPEEVDPDNETSRVPSQSSELDCDVILTIEVEPSNSFYNADAIYSDIEVLAEHSESERMGMNTTVPKKKGAVWKEPSLKNKKISNTSKLEKAALSYSQSTEEMAVAVSEMAKSISQLAEALAKLADAIKNTD